MRDSWKEVVIFKGESKTLLANKLTEQLTMTQSSFLSGYSPNNHSIPLEIWTQILYTKGISVAFRRDGTQLAIGSSFMLEKLGGALYESLWPNQFLYLPITLKPRQHYPRGI